MEIRRYRVAGRVQGVGFRWFVREQARSLGLAGWVRNEDNGEVLLEVAGVPEALDQLAGHLRSGPPAATVESLTVEPSEAVGAHELPRPFSVFR